MSTWALTQSLNLYLQIYASCIFRYFYILMNLCILQQMKNAGDLSIHMISSM